MRFRLGAPAVDGSGVQLTTLVTLANSQFGLVSRSQMVGLGMSKRQIERQIGTGLLVRARPGVYALAGVARSFEARCMEIQLWADAAGFLSSWTAGRLAGLRRMGRISVHYTVAAGFRRDQPAGVHLDHSTWFDPDDDRTARSDGLVVARGPRLLWGLAKDLSPRAFARAAEDAWHLGVCSPEELATYLAAHRRRGRGGVRTIERWLERADQMDAPAQSGFEQEMIEELERLGLGPVVRQHPLVLRSGETIHLDIAWPALRLAVEPGAAWFHGGDDGQHRDHRRDLACAELGWVIVRLDDRFRRDLRAAARSVASTLAARRRDLGATPNIPA